MVASSSNSQPLSFPRTFLASAIAACTAEALTLPLDTAKVRLQLQAGGNKYKGMLGTVATIAREEGPGALWKGIEPGLHRQCLFGGLRIGLYEPVRNLYVGKDFKGDPPLHLKIAAGLTTGALGISIASPTDLVKVRMQSEGKLAAGVPKKYPSAFAAYGIIAREEGILGLWKGLGPNIARNAIINAAELASYDQIKQSLLGMGMKDNVGTHLAAGLGAGFFAVCIGSPVDVVKSRVMGDREGKFKGVIDCFVKTARNEGPLAFYKGFIPNFGRLGSWNVAMFLTLEQVKKLLTPKEPSH
ncbi:hypothetical protein HYH02_007151 [Chlamydomonas schloesseri]|uniref:Uncoupling protein n=1 Tax=Chlamydomonas schloesseri TaxID=2026947 RepID=A0A835WIC5_9CHLO|nr:hypothetical protein HYH02_007151 [Chlamydomonas schloesseri]|eukprot:KAG2447691.1 hypothetical protein HYH02_007151 [Chlamydomonas schloesseri]